MSIPAGITSITVTGKFVDASGTALAGYVLFTPNTTVTDSTDNAIIPMAPVRATLDGTGAFSVALASTDDPQGDPSGWTYVVKVHLDVANVADRSYNIAVPAASAGGTLDLADAIEVSTPGTPSAYLRKDGGTMTGDLVLSGSTTDITVGGQITIGADVELKRIAANRLRIPDVLVVGTVEPDLTVIKAGDSAAAFNGIVLGSAYNGQDDDGTGTDQTGRIIAPAYQRGNTHGFGEQWRGMLMRKDAKHTWAVYGPQLTGTQQHGFDDTTRDVKSTGVSWKPWSWTVVHFEANDHGSIHGHLSDEMPNAVGSMETRFERHFWDRVNNVIGLDKTFLLTNLSDFVVRCSGSDHLGAYQKQVLRLSAAATNPKYIDFNNDAFGTNPRWEVGVNGDAESGSSAGSDFEVRRFNDSNTYVDSPIKVIRAGNGNILLGTGSSSTVVAQGRITIGTTTANVCKLYAEDATATNPIAKLKATAAGTASVGVLAIETSDNTKRVFDMRVTADAVARLKFDYSLGTGSGTIVFGNGTSSDTSIYRSAANQFGISGSVFLTGVAAPATPTGGGALYVDTSGNLKFKSSAGNITTVAAV